MRKILKGAVSVLMAAVLSMPLVSMTAFAEHVPVLSGLKVTVELNGAKPSNPEPLNVVLTAEDKANPMPEGSADGIYTLPMAGGGTKELGAIAFSNLGIYHYTIHQTAGTSSKGSYDGRVYHMTVSVVNTENGREPMVAIYVDGQAAKIDELVFTNSYKSGGGGGGTGGGGGGHGGGGGGNNPGGPGDGLTVIDSEGPPLANIFPEEVPLALLPKTGDTTNLALWTMLTLVSACGLVGALVMKRRCAKAER